MTRQTLMRYANRYCGKSGMQLTYAKLTYISTEKYWDRRSQSSNNAINLVMNLLNDLQTGSVSIEAIGASITSYSLAPDFNAYVVDAATGVIVASSLMPSLAGTSFVAAVTQLIPGAYNPSQLYSQYASLCNSGGGWTSYTALDGIRYDFVQQFVSNASTAYYLVSGFYASTQAGQHRCELTLSPPHIYIDIQCPNGADWSVCDASRRTPCSLQSSYNLALQATHDVTNAGGATALQSVFTAITVPSLDLSLAAKA